GAENGPGWIVVGSLRKGGLRLPPVPQKGAGPLGPAFPLVQAVTLLYGAFVPAGFDYNQDPPQGIADAAFSPDRVDTAFVDRLLSKCSDHLSLLAAPATLDRVYDFGADAFDSILDSLRASIPCVVLDVPHQWVGWTKRLLESAENILVVPAPAPATLRKEKTLMDLLRTSRPNDPPPHYSLNLVGVQNRPKIAPADFAKALDCQPEAAIPFEPA